MCARACVHVSWSAVPARMEPGAGEARPPPACPRPVPRRQVHFPAVAPPRPSPFWNAALCPLLSPPASGPFLGTCARPGFLYVLGRGRGAAAICIPVGSEPLGCARGLRVACAAAARTGPADPPGLVRRAAGQMPPLPAVPGPAYFQRMHKLHRRQSAVDAPLLICFFLFIFHAFFSSFPVFRFAPCAPLTRQVPRPHADTGRAPCSRA